MSSYVSYMFMNSKDRHINWETNTCIPTGMKTLHICVFSSIYNILQHVCMNQHD